MWPLKFIKNLGPGLFESVYEAIMAYELTNEYNLNVHRQRPIPVIWKDVKLELGFRSDLIIEEKLIVEIKSIEASSSCTYQTITYSSSINKY